MVIALLAAVITSFIVPPDEKYLDYFDYKTLACLFSVLAVVCALKNVQFFYILACNIVKKFRNIRLCTVVLVWVTFIGSMLIANDMALLTFLPLGYYVLHTAGKERYMAFTFIMQNIAANLGGMLTPFGNPQNLYLYSKFNIPIGEFTLIMLPPFILAVAMITLCCIIFVKPEPIELKSAPEKSTVNAQPLIFPVRYSYNYRVQFYSVPDRYDFHHADACRYGQKSACRS